jgi:hypothetical protein
VVRCHSWLVSTRLLQLKTISLQRSALVAAIKKGELDFTYPRVAFAVIGEILSKSTGGSTGPLYSLMFYGAADELERAAKKNSSKQPAPAEGETKPAGPVEASPPFSVWVDALEGAVKNLKVYGGAKEGHRTMVMFWHIILLFFAHDPMPSSAMLFDPDQTC